MIPYNGKLMIYDLIEQVDAIKPNSYTVAEKLAWVSELDGNIYHDLKEWYDNPEEINEAWFSARLMGNGLKLPYDEHEDYTPTVTPYVYKDGTQIFVKVSAILLAPFPYDAMYVTWLSAKIDYANGDIAKYNNAKVMFDEQYGSFMNWVNRRLLHKKTRIDYL